jgi:hypothetical protein
MKKPFIIELGSSRYIGLVLPIDNKYCDIYWDDSEVKEKYQINWLSNFKILKSDLSEHEVFAWRLKHGV